MLRENCADVAAKFVPLNTEQLVFDYSQSGLAIEDEFTTPVIEVDKPQVRRPKWKGLERSGSAIRKAPNLLQDMYGLGEPKLKSIRNGPLFDLLRDQLNAVLIGESGSGKSTCLKRLALDAARSYSKKGPVTLFVPLIYWSESGGLEQIVERQCGLPWKFVQKLAETKRLQLVLDGYNEVPDGLRRAGFNAIRNTLESLKNPPVIISARDTNELKELGLALYRVQLLNDSQGKDLLAQSLVNAEKARVLHEKLESRLEIKILASNPLMLELVAQVTQETGDLPKDRVTLIRRWLQQWFDREANNAVEGQAEFPWTYADAEKALCAIAMTARLAGKRTVGRNDAIAAAHRERTNDPARLLQAALSGNVLKALDENELGFQHESLQEYLCAVRLLDNPDQLRHVQESDCELWESPVKLAAELRYPLPLSLLQVAWTISGSFERTLLPLDDTRSEIQNLRRLLFDWMREKAAAGTARFQLRLGYCLDIGLGCSIDHPEAV